MTPYDYFLMVSTIYIAPHVPRGWAIALSFVSICCAVASKVWP